MMVFTSFVRLLHSQWRNKNWRSFLAVAASFSVIVVNRRKLSLNHATCHCNGLMKMMQILYVNCFAKKGVLFVFVFVFVWLLLVFPKTTAEALLKRTRKQKKKNKKKKPTTTRTTTTSMTKPSFVTAVAESETDLLVTNAPAKMNNYSRQASRNEMSHLQQCPPQCDDEMY